MITGKAKKTQDSIYPKVGYFPSPLVSQKDKLTIDYAYQYAQGLFTTHYGKNNALMDEKRARFQTNNKYRSGMQDMGQYLDMLKLNEDTSTSNLNLSPVAVIPHFVDSMVEEIADASWQVNAKSSDSIGTQEHQMVKQKLLANLMMKPAMKQLAETLGMAPPEEQASILESVEEIELYVNMVYKSMVEMASEIGVQLVFDLNGYEEIRRQLIDDTITHNICGAYVDVAPRSGIKIERIEPEDLIYSYSKSSDFKNIQHGGHLTTCTVSDLRKLAPDLEEHQLKEIAQGASSNNNPESHMNNGMSMPTSSYNDSVYDSNQVTLMHFEFLSTDRLVHERTERNGYSLMSRADENYEVPKNSKYKKERREKPVKNVYKGIWVVGTDYVLNYGLKHNTPRPNNNLSEARIGYHIYAHKIYKNNFRSLVERMRPFADQIQINHIKIQQLIASARPNGLLIEVGSLKDVSLDGVKNASPLELKAVYNSEGHMFYKAIDDEGRQTGQPPFRELTNGVDFNGLQALIGNYNHNLQMLRDVSGFIPERSGVTKADQLVGVTESAIKSSMNSIGFVRNAWINVTKGIAETTATLLGDVIKFEPETYSKALDGLTEELLMGFIELPYRELGITIEIEPDTPERMALEQALMFEVQNGTLNTETVHQIRQVKNLSLAYQFIAMNRKKMQRQKMQEAQQNVQYQIEQQNAATQAASELRKMELELETASKIDIIDAEQKKEAYLIMLKSQLEGNPEQAKAMMRQQEREDLHNKQMQKEAYKEDRKDARTEYQIQQKNNAQ